MIRKLLILLIFSTVLNAQLLDLFDDDADKYPLRIILSGDIQVEQTAEFATVRTAVDSVNAYSPDLIVFAGDLGWPGGYQGAPEGAEYYDSLYNILSNLNSPYIFTSGNHDNDIIQSTSDSNFTSFLHFVDRTNARNYLSIDTLKATDGWGVKGDFTLSFRGVKKIFDGKEKIYSVLFSHDNNSSASAAAGGYNGDMFIDADTTWLRARLDELNKPNSYVILHSHYPPYSYGWYNPLDYGNYTNTAEIKDIINDYDNILFVHNQHIHQWYLNTSFDEDILYMVSSRFADGASAFNGECSGFYVCDITQDSIKFTAVRTGAGTLGSNYTMARNPVTIPTTPTDSLVTDLALYYSFEETSGIRTDSINSYDLAQAGTVDSSIGKIGNCVEFNNDAADYLYCNTYNLPNNGDFTVTAWVKVNVINDTESKVFVANGINSNTSELALYMSTSNHFSGLHYTPLKTVSSTDLVSINTWYFVTFIRDATNDFIHIYVNASQHDSTASSSTVAGSNNIAIGSFNGGSSTRPFNGFVDEVGIWERKLTETEIIYLYNSGNGRTYTEIKNYVQ